MAARVEAPTLSCASVRAVGVAAIRLALGIGFVVTSILRGLDGGPALVLTPIGLGQRSRTGAADPGDALQVPPEAGSTQVG